MRKISLILGFLTASVATSASGQWRSTISLTTSFDDNAFRNYSAQSDVVSQAQVYFDRQWQIQKWLGVIYYDGSLSHFAEYDDRTNQFHSLGLSAGRNLGESDARLSAGSEYLQRFDREAYNIYDFSQFSGFVHFNAPVKAIGKFYSGYDVRQRRYRNLATLSHWEHVFFARFNIALPARTTLLLGSEIGYKDYLSQAIADTVAAGQSGRGTGSRQRIVYSREDNPSAGQWVHRVRVAHGLFESTGISGFVRRRINFGDGSRFVTGLTTGYTEDELYDDRYGYESWETGATLTQLLPLRMTLRVGYENALKDYQRLALDLDGNPFPSAVLRSDKRRQIWLGLEKEFGGKRNFTIYLEYLHIKNFSNDPYYDFNVSVPTVGIQLGFE